MDGCARQPSVLIVRQIKMLSRKRAYTLVELLIMVVILAATVLVAVPKLQIGALKGKRADTVAGKIVTMLERTRSLAIAEAATNNQGFTLRMTGGASFDRCIIRRLDTFGQVDSYDFPSDVGVSGGSTFDFEPLGNLTTDSDTEIIVVGGAKTFTIKITPATGMIRCVQN